MAGFFSRRKKKEEYQGFQKYGEELHRHSLRETKRDNTGTDEEQKNKINAGLAASAALRKHYQQKNEGTVGNNVRSNSLMGSHAMAGRGIPMRKYQYNPRASYVAGPAANRGGGVRRANSLAGGSYRPNYMTHSYSNSSNLNSLNSHSSNLRPDVFEGYGEPVLEYDGEDEEEVTVTTKTVRVSDSMGRTQSLTIETIKKLPDGSIISSTTTKNVSRSNSRHNSMNSLNMNNRSPPRNNSLGLNSGALPSLNGYNLSKIEEDLHDFDYNYELDSSHLANSGKGAQITNDGNPSNLKSNHSENIRDTEVLLSSPRGSNGKDILAPVKPILKKEDALSLHRTANADLANDPSFVDANEYISSENKSGGEHKHPYSNLRGSPRLSNSRFQDTNKYSTNKASSPGGKYNRSIVSGLEAPHVSSNQSRTSSIKFSEHVETIPILRENLGSKQDDSFEKELNETESREIKLREKELHEQELYEKELYEKELYEKALIVAKNKVYGSEQGGAITGSTSDSSAFKMPKGKTYLSDSPIIQSTSYKNHHKAFATHSLRESFVENDKSRKKRVKEEKKQQRDLEKNIIKQQKEEQTVSKGSPIQGEANEESKKPERRIKLPSIFSRKHEIPEDSEDKIINTSNINKHVIATYPGSSIESCNQSDAANDGMLEAVDEPALSKNDVAIPTSKETQQSSVISNVISQNNDPSIISEERNSNQAVELEKVEHINVSSKVGSGMPEEGANEMVPNFSSVTEVTSLDHTDPSVNVETSDVRKDGLDSSDFMELNGSPVSSITKNGSHNSRDDEKNETPDLETPLKKLSSVNDLDDPLEDEIIEIINKGSSKETLHTADMNRDPIDIDKDQHLQRQTHELYAHNETLVSNDPCIKDSDSENVGNRLEGSSSNKNPTEDPNSGPSPDSIPLTSLNVNKKEQKAKDSKKNKKAKSPGFKKKLMKFFVNGYRDDI